MERLLLCDSESCGSIATAFGLKQSTKLRSCESHIPTLISKGFTVFSIAGYNFISSPSDVSAFEERKAKSEKGMGNLTALDSACEAELAAAIAALEAEKMKVLKVVEGRFEDLKLAATRRCREVKQQLTILRYGFTEFLSSKNNVLSPTAELLCCDLNVSPRLIRMAVVDVSDRIARILIDEWSVPSVRIEEALLCLDERQNSKVVAALLKEATEQAKKGVLEALQYADSLLGADREFDKEKEAVRQELLQYSKAQLKLQLDWLQWAWQLRYTMKASDKETVTVGLCLSPHLYLHSGNFTEAEEILRKCYEIECNHSELTTKTVEVCTEICAVYFHSGKFEQAETCGQWALDAFAHEYFTAETYWVTILYITYSMRMQYKDTDAKAVFDALRSPNFPGESRFAGLIRQIVCGTEAFFDGCMHEAEKWLAQAVRLGESHFPTSVFTAFALAHLATAVDENLRDLYHKQAQVMFETVAPQSIHAACNQTNHGNLYFKQKRWNEAEEKYLKAQCRYGVIAPQSLHAGKNHTNLGLVYMNICRSADAEESFQQAQSIFEIAGPQSLDAAKNMYNLGNLCFDQHRWNEAERCYRQAQSIYECAAPQSLDAGKNFFNLGNMYSKRKRAPEAEEAYRLAQSIFEVAGPNSNHAANNLYNLGALLYNSGRWNEAEECYKQARSIYEIVAPQSTEAALNCYNMGVLYEARGKLDESIHHFQSASEIYAANRNTELKKKADAATTRVIGLRSKVFRRSLPSFMDH